MPRLPRLLPALLLASMLLTACAGGGIAEPDPWQTLNRGTYAVNERLDRYLLRPVARVYAFVPQFMQRGIGNFFNNVGEPYTVVNDVLQAKPVKALRDSGRFAVNTTVGLGGLFDPATKLGLVREPEDFGQTLAVWRVPAGPYLVLPLLGPSSVRDAIGRAPAWLGGDPVGYLDTPARWYVRGLAVVDVRAGLLGFDQLLAQQPDAYAFVREAYLQNRQLRVRDGAADTKAAELDDELLDLLDEE